jgi:hypothetical protein
LLFKEHRRSFITAKDFDFLSRHGINTVRIPVGWWITQDPYPPSPFVGGSLAALDLAFSWAQYVVPPNSSLQYLISLTFPDAIFTSVGLDLMV